MTSTRTRLPGDLRSPSPSANSVRLLTPNQSSRLIFADATNRDVTLYPSGNNYTLFLSSPLRNIERVDLVSARVPNTMYNLTNGSNIFVITTSTQTVPVSIAPGFYSVYELASAVTGLITMTYLTWAGKFVFSSLVPFTVQTSKAFADLSGFEHGTLTSALAPANLPTFAGQNVLVASGLPHMNPLDQIFLDIDELRTPHHMYTGSLTSARNQVGSQSLTQVTVTGANAERAFAPITMDVGSGCMKHFSENKDYVVSVVYPEPIRSLQRLTIRWLDGSGLPLNFNGADWNSFILRVHLQPPPEPEDEEEDALEKRVTDLEIKRMVDDALAKEKPPQKPSKKTRFGKWTVVLLALLVLLGWVVYKRFIYPNEP
jgi:hypothetical protein